MGETERNGESTHTHKFKKRYNMLSHDRCDGSYARGPCSVSGLIPSLPVEGEGRAGEAGALNSALQTDPLTHQEVLDTASRDCHGDPAYK